MTSPQGKRLEGKAAIVTGAGRGLGRAYAIALAAEGAAVVVNDLGSDLSGHGASSSPADETVAVIAAAGGTAVTDYHDVTDYEQAGAIVGAAVDAFGKLDVIVTNAGMDRRGYLYEITPEDWRATLDVHVNGQFNCSAQAARVMKEQKSGSIINITSGAFYLGVTRLGGYGASKGAVFGLMRTLSREMEPFGVRVNCVAPGLTQTRAVDHFLESLRTVERMPEEQVRAFEATMAQPEDIAPIIVYLASDASKEITGFTFQMDRQSVSVMRPILKPTRQTEKERWDVDDLAAVAPEMIAQAMGVTEASREWP